jgi:lincosamide nucleotidyltransferase A/C/D/E
MSGMELDQVLVVLRALDMAGVRHWVGGGWGVDILVGRRTRAHRDLDLAVDATAETRAVTALQVLGYSIETDQRPTRVELAGPDDCWVDLHPVAFDEDGSGRQADLTGGWFDYPAAAFTSAVIGGRWIACLSADQQLVFHTGYEPRPIDHHDIALLRELVPSGCTHSPYGP